MYRHICKNVDGVLIQLCRINRILTYRGEYATRADTFPLSQSALFILKVTNFFIASHKTRPGQVIYDPKLQSSKRGMHTRGAGKPVGQCQLGNIPSELGLKRYPTFISKGGHPLLHCPWQEALLFRTSLHLYTLAGDEYKRRILG